MGNDRTEGNPPNFRSGYRYKKTDPFGEGVCKDSHLHSSLVYW